jgi:chloramphenicol 3-O-phosphotransferase
VYTEPEGQLRDFTQVEESADRGVRVMLGDILPLLADAVASNRTWLSDFADDEITISSDLHDVLQAYRHFRRPGA